MLFQVNGVSYPGEVETRNDRRERGVRQRRARQRLAPLPIVADAEVDGQAIVEIVSPT